MATAEASILSTRDLADRFGVPLSTAVLIVERLGISHRIGRNRAILTADVERVRTALIGAGYLKPEAAGR